MSISYLDAKDMTLQLLGARAKPRAISLTAWVGSRSLAGKCARLAECLSGATRFHWFYNTALLRLYHSSRIRTSRAILAAVKYGTRYVPCVLTLVNELPGLMLKTMIVISALQYTHTHIHTRTQRHIHEGAHTNIHAQTLTHMTSIYIHNGRSDNSTVRAVR